MAPIKVRVTSPSKLTPAASARSGMPNWWLAHAEPGSRVGAFVDLGSIRIRGTHQFDAELCLEPGRYILGVGKQQHSLRYVVVVADSGNVSILKR